MGHSLHIVRLLSAVDITYLARACCRYGPEGYMMQAPEQSNEEEAIEIERKRLEKLHEEPVRRYVLLFTLYFVDWYAGWLLRGSNLFDNTQQYS